MSISPKVSLPGGSGGAQYWTRTGTSLSPTTSEDAVVMSGRFQIDKGADVSADAFEQVTLGNDGNFFEFTGANDISTILSTDWQEGSVIYLYFTVSRTVYNDALDGDGAYAVIFPDGNDHNFIAGDILTLQLNDLKWRVPNNDSSLSKVVITGQTAVTAVGTDYVLISDTSDSGNLKKALVSDFGTSTDDIVFTYDVNGNVDTKTVGSTVYTYTYDVDYNVDTISGGGYLKTFTYDVNGNVDEIIYSVI